MTPIPPQVRAKMASDIMAAGLLAQRQSPRPSIVAPLDFNSRVDGSAGNWACWPWRGRLGSHGYGVVRVRDAGWPTTVGVHRVAYYLATGFWSTHLRRGTVRKVIRHLCHNKACCNPRHLLVGSFGDNAWDDLMRQRGVDLVAVRMLVGEGPFLPVAGIADDPFPASRGRVFA